MCTYLYYISQETDSHLNMETTANQTGLVNRSDADNSINATFSSEIATELLLGIRLGSVVPSVSDWIEGGYVDQPVRELIKSNGNKTVAITSDNHVKQIVLTPTSFNPYQMTLIERSNF